VSARALLLFVAGAVLWHLPVATLMLTPEPAGMRVFNLVTTPSS
jgi:hypothetical protein